MRKDELHVRYLSVPYRFADLINGVVFKGKQVILAADLDEYDTQTGIWKPNSTAKNSTKKQRDMVRKVALGANFIVVGVENQEEVHYLMPVRVMGYDTSEYEHQASLISKEVRKEKGLSASEYLSGFKKDSKLLPCITFVLYYGKEWDGSRDLHGLLDFSDMPSELVEYVANYSIHLIEVRKFEDTDVFKTDLKLVFDFIKYSEDKNKLRKLVEENE